MTDDTKTCLIHTPDHLRVFMGDTFLAVLAQAARLYTETEVETGLSLRVDLSHFVDWCKALREQPPASEHAHLDAPS
jgi:hypothetical protein